MSVFILLLFSLETTPGLQGLYYLSTTQSKVILTKHVLSTGNLQAFSQVWIQPTSKSLDPHIRPVTYIGSTLYDGPPEIQICSLLSCTQMGHNFSGKCLPYVSTTVICLPGLFDWQQAPATESPCCPLHLSRSRSISTSPPPSTSPFASPPLPIRHLMVL